MFGKRGEGEGEVREMRVECFFFWGCWAGWGGCLGERLGLGLGLCVLDGLLFGGSIGLRKMEMEMG